VCVCVCVCVCVYHWLAPGARCVSVSLGENERD
jgi:hypothetical protein